MSYFIDFLHQNPNIGSHLSKGFYGLIFISVFLQILGNFIRAAKSKYLLNNVRESSSVVLFKGLAVGGLFNSLLPLRLGELVRAFYTGDALSISKTTVFMSIVFERIIDSIILSLCFFACGFAIQSTSQSAFIFMVKAGGILFVFSSVLLLIVVILRSENKYILRSVHKVSSVFNERISSRIRLMAWSSIHGTKLMLNNKISLRKYYLASAGMWAIYFMSVGCIALAFFWPISITKLSYVIQTCFAGIGTPVGPGYVGTFYAIVTHQLQKIGLAGGGFSTFTWFVLVVPISIIGIYVLIRQRVGEKKEAPEQESLINKLYRENDISSEFRHFLDAYFKGEQINKILSQAELDNKFSLIKSFKGGSNAHTMLVWQNEELKVKKITLLQYADKLAAQAQWLIDRDRLPHLPKVTDQERTGQYYSFDLAYKEDFSPFFEYIHSNSVAKSSMVIENILDFMDKCIYGVAVESKNVENVQEYIQKKVLAKVSDTANVSSEISQLIVFKNLKINSNNYDNMLEIIEKIRKNKKAMNDLSCYEESPIHGDLTIDNIIVSPGGDFMIIDPNDENQVSTPAVDFGKLYQSLHSGYEFLIQLNSCTVSGNEITFEESKSQKYEELFKRLDTVLKKKLSPKDYRVILFHEAVHYCRMLTYRANIDQNTVAVYYSTAVKLFNEFQEQYE
ncbi:MAG: flippase-like domain-containing protein [bacterium]